MITQGLHRPEALARARRAAATMSACRLCAFRCGVDRTAGPAGACRADAMPRVFHEGIEWAGETGLVPTYVVSLSGCNMTCSFCLTGADSQNARRGAPLDAEAIGARVDAAAPSLRSVTLLGGEPSIHLAGALEIAARVPRSLKLVWKTNAYASEEGLRILGRVPDVVLADFKFGNDDCARRLAGIPNYTATVRSNLRSASKRSRLIVRHLLMPGHLDCCLAPVADSLAREMPDVPISLMTGFLPVFRAANGRTNRPEECARAREIVAGREIPWTLDPRGRTGGEDEIWIDPAGRICVDSASAALVSLMKDFRP